MKQLLEDFVSDSNELPLDSPLTDRLTRFTFKTSILAFISTVLIMFLFDVIGEHTDSMLAHIGEMAILVCWFLPDLLSIPVVGIAAAVGTVMAAMQIQLINTVRNLLALALSIANASLVMHRILPELPF